YITLDRGKETVFRKGYIVRDKRSSPPAATDLSGFLFMVDSCVVEPGAYCLNVEIEDLQRKKKNLLGILRKSYISSRLKDAYIEVPSYSSDRLAIGDPILIWSRKGSSHFIPNPMRIYGLKNDTLSFYVSALMRESSQIDSMDVRMAVLGQAGELMGEEYFRTPVRNRRAAFFGVFDVNVYPAGMYGLLVEAFDGSGSRSSTKKGFSVAWELINWQKPERDILNEARIILSDSEFDDFRCSGLGEQEKIMKEFWKKLDPTPHTAVNEAYEKFVERLSYADIHFDGFARGALTDRGQIYIRFGPPNDIVYESVPVNRNDLSKAIRKLEDEFDVIVHSFQSQRRGYLEFRPKLLSGRGRSFRGMEGMDTGAYELWIYNLNGDPIFERDKFITIQIGRRFLFVDLDGYGEFQMIGTSEDCLK
ncbi:MAG: GWxTD domain-containing protein, partial [Candidatus Krumholzibacteria bacterium]|nr:GWxTD domain-containing protein [Candidatus Krumholzibacteria bacterium]